MKMDEIQNFVDSFITFYNNSLQLSKAEEKRAIQNMKDDGLLSPPKSSFSFDESIKDIADSGLVFFNPKSGLEIAFGINSAFPVDKNPFLNPEESAENTLFLMANESFSVELVHFCVNCCKDKLSYFREKQGKQVLENLDFMLRFWKKEVYHTQPSISLIG